MQKPSDNIGEGQQTAERLNYPLAWKKSKKESALLLPMLESRGIRNADWLDEKSISFAPVGLPVPIKTFYRQNNYNIGYKYCQQGNSKFFRRQVKLLQENLKKARERLGLSQVEVAEKVGISQPMYSYYESGLKTPTLYLAKAMANVLGVSLDYLVDNEDKHGECQGK